MKVALDTNILVYAEGVNGPMMKTAAVDLIDDLPRHAAVVPVQVLGELFRVLVRKARYTPSAAREAILGWRDTFQPIGTSDAILIRAAELAASHQLVIWDAVILSAAAESGCRLLLSEDMQEGFTWNGTTVTNPFAPVRHELLEVLLSSAGRA